MTDFLSEVFINKLIKYNTTSNTDLLNGKNIALNFMDIHKVLLNFQQDYINLMPYDEYLSDIKIFFSKEAIFKLITKVENIQNLIDDEKILVSGDLKTAKLFSQFLINANIDWQLCFAKLDQRGYLYNLNHFCKDLNSIFGRF